MYDRLAASVQLLETGVTAGSEPLTRRHRFLPVTYDVDGDLAVTVFLHRSHGGASWDSNVLTRTDGEWWVHGGGGSNGADLDVLTHVPTRESLGGYVRSDGGGGVSIGGGGRFRRSRWAQHADLVVTPEVATVETPTGRRLVRPAHGRLVVLWWGHAPLPLTLRDADGATLATVTVGSDH
ncbi:hypothetical protein ACXR2U_16860 [Jatrophihabitans sp. YIM 134969]